MKATELRIGNYVFDCEGYVDKVTAIITPQIDNEKNCYPWLRGTTAIMLDNFVGAHNVDAIDPIPITQEWLERFGFVYDNDEDELILDAKSGISLMCAHDSIVYYKGNLEPLWVDVLLNIEYVHQLQNLYFALTGNELTIQP